MVGTSTFCFSSLLPSSAMMSGMQASSAALKRG
jgi:hypothetical protein